MTIRLVDEGWRRELAEAARADASELRIICPFIKVGALEGLLSRQPVNVQVITRFNLADFAEGVSDIAVLQRLLDINARVRGVRNLHAKARWMSPSAGSRKRRRRRSWRYPSRPWTG